MSEKVIVPREVAEALQAAEGEVERLRKYLELIRAMGTMEVEENLGEVVRTDWAELADEALDGDDID